MLDHLGVVVSSFAKSRAFYVAALAPLGAKVLMEFPDPKHPGGPQQPVAGIGRDGKPTFWISEGKPTTPIHVAFVAKDRAAVDAFHRAALEAGAKDNGAPGLRPHYHANYYGAFVLDPDGNNVEAVCHTP